MTRLSSRPTLLLTLAAAVLAVTLALQSRAGEALTVSELAERTHIHGIAVDPNDPSRLYLATHHGFYAASLDDGATRRISETGDDLMGFTPHPADPSVLYASGHPAGGGNLGVITSTDGGRTWQRLAEGVGGPVDFHQMDVSKADPGTIYGVHGGLQVSRDGGRSWAMVGPAPEGLIDLAASARDADTLYAATETGLRISRDGGRTWRDAFLLRRPATMVETTPDGRVYAFMVDTGLLRAAEPSLDWTVVNDTLGDRVLLHLAPDPTDADRLYAATHHGEILASPDAGQSWAPLAAGGAGG